MSRYAAAHDRSKLAGPGDARPTAFQIIQDENLVGKLSDKVFLVTGVSSGLGIETMRVLSLTGAHVFGTVRSLSKGQKVVDGLVASNPNGGKMELIEMDLESQASVRKGAADFLSKSGGKLNCLITNAGIMAVPFRTTPDGFESQFGTNHLGHFLLFQLVKNTLLSTATPAYPSRVVSVSSTGHRFGSVRFADNFTWKPEEYSDWASYGQAKTANIWLANAIERHYGAQHLHATSLHPGGIMTNLGNHLDAEAWKAYDTPEYRVYFKDVGQGAATQVYAAISEEWKNKGGKYLSDCVEQKLVGV
ncbi:NAD(P)-binding protein [Polyplosphaeria fusca]|uniref:NAD(P)-binding protein n=1 Tax=Polyplosphaeria fusca TaxID=682080 RepID=A0A9P4R5W6_9PLEO|nr:NAD(P)-binding protein [Polyplosphaeria fusca]